MAFWGKVVTEVEPAVVSFVNSPKSQRLRVSMATIDERKCVSEEHANGITKLYCEVANCQRVIICSLTLTNNTRSLDIELAREDNAVFYVQGPHGISVTGYFVKDEPPTIAAVDIQNGGVAEQPSLQLRPNVSIQVTDNELQRPEDNKCSSSRRRRKQPQHGRNKMTAEMCNVEGISVEETNNVDAAIHWALLRNPDQSRENNRQVPDNQTISIDGANNLNVGLNFHPFLLRSPVESYLINPREDPPENQQENGDPALLNQQKSKKKKSKKKRKTLEVVVVADEATKQDHGIEVSQPSEGGQLARSKHGVSVDGTNNADVGLSSHDALLRDLDEPNPREDPPEVQQENDSVSLLNLIKPKKKKPKKKRKFSPEVPVAIEGSKQDHNTEISPASDNAQPATLTLGSNRKYESSTQDIVMAIPLARDGLVFPSTVYDVNKDGDTAGKAFDDLRSSDSSDQEVTIAAIPLTCNRNPIHEDAFVNLRTSAVAKQDSAIRGRMVVCALAKWEPTDEKLAQRPQKKARASKCLF